MFCSQFCFGLASFLFVGGFRISNVDQNCSFIVGTQHAHVLLVFCFFSRSLQNFPNIIKRRHTVSLSREWEKKRKIRARSQNSNAAAWHVFDLFIYLFIIFFSCLLFGGVVRGTQSRNNRAEHCSRISDKANCFLFFYFCFVLFREGFVVISSYPIISVVIVGPSLISPRSHSRVL